MIAQVSALGYLLYMTIWDCYQIIVGMQAHPIQVIKTVQKIISRILRTKTKKYHFRFGDLGKHKGIQKAFLLDIQVGNYRIHFFQL